MSFQGRVALVIGCGENLGKAQAQQLARAGTHIALHYTSTESGDGSMLSRGEMAGTGVRVSIHVGDLHSDAAIESLVEEVCQTHGNIDIIVDSAGHMVRKAFTRASAAEQVKAFAYAAFVDTQRRVWASRYQQAVQRQ